MNKIPILNLRKAQYGMKTSSEDYNNNLDNILFNLQILFEEINMQTDLLQQIEETLRIENQYQMIKIQNLQQDLTNMKLIYENIENNLGTYNKSIYAKDMYTNDTILQHEKAEINKAYNITTLPVLGAVESKVYIYNEIEDKIIIPDELELKVIPEVSEYDVSIKDNEIKNAFNGNNNETWKRKYIYGINSEESEIDTTTSLEIKLPENIINNRNVNTIQINPFPTSSTKIEKIEYYFDGAIQLIPGWPTMKNSNNQIIPVGIEDKGIQVFYFSPTPMDKIKITMSQSKYVIEDNKKTYYLGAQEIGIFNIDYKSNVGRFFARTSLEGKTEIKIIEQIIPKFKNEDLLSDKTPEKSSLFTFDLYQVNLDETLEFTSDQFPIQINKNRIVIKCSIFYDEKNNIAPALSHIEVKYRDFV